jgi:hypothetical protein
MICCEITGNFHVSQITHFSISSQAANHSRTLRRTPQAMAATSTHGFYHKKTARQAVFAPAGRRQPVSEGTAR